MLTLPQASSIDRRSEEPHNPSGKESDQATKSWPVCSSGLCSQGSRGDSQMTIVAAEETSTHEENSVTATGGETALGDRLTAGKADRSPGMQGCHRACLVWQKAGFGG